MLPQSVKLHILKYKILEFKDFEQNIKTFLHMLYNFIFSHINSIINYIYPTCLNFSINETFQSLF